MTNEELWVTAADPNPLVPHLSGITLRKHLLFAVSCCRLLHDWLIDARSRQSVDTAEAFADGEASLNELESASNRASIAAGIIGGAPARVVSLVFYDIERWHHVARRSAERGVVDGGLVESSITRGLQQLLFEVSRSFVEDEPSERSRVLLTQANLLRDIFGNPFRSISFDASWRTSTAVAIAKQMYESRDFSAMPILADALQDAGCEHDDILDHCHAAGGVHVRGCWVVDLVLEKT